MKITVNKKTSFFLILSSLLLISIISADSIELSSILDNSEIYLKEQANKIKENFENKCKIIEKNKCSEHINTIENTSTNDLETKDINSLRFLEEKTTNSSSETSTDDLSYNNNYSFKGSCNLLSNNKKLIFPKIHNQLKCLNEFKITNSFSNYIKDDSANNSENSCFSQKLLLSKSTINTPLNNSLISKPQIQEEICASGFLDKEFPKIYENNNLITFQKFATNSGMLRRYPGGIQTSEFDHKKQSWFKSAINRPLNIIFAADFSGYMNNGFKSSLVKKTLLKIIDQLDSSSWTGIVPFSKPFNNEYFSNTENLIKMTVENKAKLIEKINDVEFFGNAEVDLTKINDFISKTKSLNLGICCDNSKTKEELDNNFKDTLVVYLVHDISSLSTETENSKESSANTTDSISTESSNPNYSYDSIYLNFGELKNSFLLEQQCNSSYDLYYDIDSPKSIDSFISYFTQYLSLGSKRDKPVWNVDDSVFGLGQTLSGSMPIYVSNELLGVYSIDIPLYRIQENYTEYDFEISYYTSQNDKCLNKSVVSTCFIENIRQYKCFGDSKSFEQKCLEEKSNSKMNNCLNDNSMENIYNNKDFICSNLMTTENSDIVENKNAILCCEGKNTALMSLGKKINYYLSVENIDPSDDEKKSDSSFENSDSSKTPIDSNHLATPLDNTSSSTIANNNSSSQLDSNKNNIPPPKEDDDNSKIYLLLLIVIAVIIFVIWYMKKNEPKAYLNNSNNRELSQYMSQSTSANYYNQK